MIDHRQLADMRIEEQRLRMLESKVLVEAGNEADPERKASLERDAAHWKAEGDAVAAQITKMLVREGKGG